MTSAALRPTSRLRRWGMRALVVLFALLLVEVLLQLACLVSPTISLALAPWRGSMILDERLGMRGDPAYPGHDANGYRNSRVPEAAEIVAIGDSQTYGASVAPDDAWPRQLEKLSGHTVYNLSFGGWDPVRYRAVLADALALKPKLVIVGVYPGNDLYGAFRSCYSTELAPELRDPAAAAEIERLERAAPLESEMAQLTEKTAGYSVSAGWRNAGRVLSERIKLLALCRAMRLRYVAWQDGQWDTQKQVAAASPEDLSVFESEAARTILTSRYRARGLDLDDARIAAGLKVTERALADMARQCRAADCRLLVLLIPVKEYVFAPLVEDTSRHAGLDDVCRQQRAAIEQLTEYLRQEDIAVIDAAPILTRLVEHSEGNPYLPNTDGHPSPTGHRAIAEKLAEEVAKQPLLKP